MGTQRVQMKGVLPLLVRLACFAGVRDFCSASAALVGPVKNIFFLNSLVPIAHQAGQAIVLGRLSLSMCLCRNPLCGRNATHAAASFRNYKDKSNLNLLLQDTLTTM
jgi:hypothetical protein